MKVALLTPSYKGGGIKPRVFEGIKSKQIQTEGRNTDINEGKTHNTGLVHTQSR